MKMIFAFILLALGSLAARAQDKPPLQVLSEVSLDLDGDGIADRVATVLVGAADKAEKREDGSYWLQGDETVDLYFYMGNGDKTLDLSSKPSFIKKNIVDSEKIEAVFPLVQKGKASVILTSCYGCGASISWGETLTIVSRNHQFLVAGFSRDWDENVHIGNNGDVETTMGQCDINFLTGKGLVATGDDINKLKPLKVKFHSVKLADWSFKKFPEACKG